MTCPAGVISPIASALGSVNQMLPSGPAMIWSGDTDEGSGYSVKVPAGVITPNVKVPTPSILPKSTKQRFPSCSIAIAPMDSVFGS